MIFQRALRRELVSAAGAVFTTLFTITITVMLIKILGQAAGGKIASGDVIALIGFESLNLMPVILILTGFISVLLAVTRSYQDSEMVVWFASGLSLMRWVRPVLTFGLPLIVLTALLSFLVTPWAIQRSAEFKERFAKREDIAKVSPGQFKESASADRVFFVEGVSGDASKVRNVFVNTVKDGRISVVVAQEGATDVNQRGDKFLIMEKGRRYEGVPNQADFQIMEFERYGVLVARQSNVSGAEKSTRSMPTMALLEDRSALNMGELLWRISLPLMSLCLLLLAIPLSFVNPRGGPSMNLLIALLLFIVYGNTVNVFQAAVQQGRMAFVLAWWPMHLLAACLIVLLFSWRLTVNSRYHPVVIWSRIKRAWLFRQGELQ